MSFAIGSGTDKGHLLGFVFVARIPETRLAAFCLAARVVSVAIGDNSRRVRHAKYEFHIRT
jgi:hypothetical protein